MRIQRKEEFVVATVWIADKDYLIFAGSSLDFALSVQNYTVKEYSVFSSS